MSNSTSAVIRPPAQESKPAAPEPPLAARPLKLAWRSGLVAAAVDGTDLPVKAHRCFPWSDRAVYISLRDAKDNEVALLETLDELDTESRDNLSRALEETGFVMEIERIESIEDEFEIRSWKVLTRQGARTFQNKRDEWPRHMADGSYLIRDVAGDLYRIADPEALDPASRKMLWAFAG